MSVGPRCRCAPHPLAATIAHATRPAPCSSPRRAYRCQEAMVLPDGATLAVMLVVVPVALTVLLSMIAADTAPPLIFACCRCQRRFQRKAHRPLARACPWCGARDWNLGDAATRPPDRGA